ncbi:MAG: class II aldolase/adducin family protein [Spirochaetales bacterium]|nr:class II aldolase/adducin family protein [Spirochaetales bacterium]MCF7936992.1 class II aldolase/adducin family protein [Spirochaetales bacterium]
MKRIYGYGMTTTSGGNLSIMDENGDIWITPGSVDKGSLRPDDIVRVTPDGTVHGRRKPSSEFPFHQAIYRARPDVHAVVHGHPPALVSFSIVRRIPDTRILPKSRQICGEVGFAPYAVPGSEELGKNISETFEKGHDTVLLENHGIACSGKTLHQAFQRFETLDFCARLIIQSRQLGSPQVLSQEQLNFIKGDSHLLPEIDIEKRSGRELELRKELVKFIHRAYQQMLITSTEGTFSARISDDEFLITPYGLDRYELDPSDFVLIRNLKRERGKVPSRSVLLHQEIYRRQPEINAVVIAHPTNVMAFGISGVHFDTRTIPESYLFLRDIPSVPYGTQYKEREWVAGKISPESPLMIIENDALITSGKSLLQAFDLLEVAEYSAKSVVFAQHLGEVKKISDEQAQQLEDAFWS